jgi:hypothetical protein
LTVTRTFDVIGFANRSVFCIGKAERAIMTTDREFSFAAMARIYTISSSPQASKQP